MRFLYFKGSPAKILLPSAEATASAEDARARLLAGAELTGCVVAGLDLAGERIDTLVLRNCVVEDSNFANTSFQQMRLERVVIATSTFIGVQARSVEVKGSVFDACRFDLAELSGLMVTETSAFLSCSLRETDLSSSSIPACIFHDCALSGADITSTRLDGGDLRASALADVHGLSTLSSVTLSPDQVPDLLAGVRRDLHLAVSDSEAGPTCGWREAPEC